MHRKFYDIMDLFKQNKFHIPFDLLPFNETFLKPNAFSLMKNYQFRL